MKFKEEDFPLCGHPELTGLGQKPEPARMIGTCPQHDAICPVCRWGYGCQPLCKCNEEVK